MDALEELEVWKRSKQLAVSIYKILRFCRDRGYKDQITRASISVPSNIAEGYERYSNKEFVNYLRIAKGSCAEVRTQLIIGREIGYLDFNTANALIQESFEISKMLHGLMKYCKNHR